MSITTAEKEANNGTIERRPTMVINREESHMDIKKEANRISFENEGKRIAWIDFPEVENDVVNVTHTVVLPEYEGQGIAGKLVSEFADEMRSQGKKTLLSCSYAVAWFKRHPEYEDVLQNKEEDYNKPPTCSL